MTSETFLKIRKLWCAEDESAPCMKVSVERVHELKAELIKNNPSITLELVERLKRENEYLLSQVKIVQEVSDELGIIGMVGSIAWKAQMMRLKI